MKKLKLNANAQGSALNRNELKKVFGGLEQLTEEDSFAGCSAICDDGSERRCAGAKCSAKDGEGCNHLNPNGSTTYNNC